MATNNNVLDTSSVNDVSDATLIGNLVREKVLSLLRGGHEEEQPDLMARVNGLSEPMKTLAIDFLEGGSKRISRVTFWEINEVVHVVQELKTTVHNTVEDRMDVIQHANKSSLDSFC